MNLIFSIILILSLNLSILCNATVIESVDDTDLVHLIKGEDSVVVLFTKNQCKECDEYERVLEHLQEDLKESLNAIFVKITNSPMVSIYKPNKEPALLFFRRGIPLLYHGEIKADDIIEKFMDNRDPIVKELSDANFEHLTQASTGATTGDWFVFFYSSDCIVCQRLYAIWEAVGADLKRKMNVAKVNRLESGISTAKRFAIQKSPAFLYIRQGKFYVYKSKEYTPEAFIKFVEETYHIESTAEKVPSISSPVIDMPGMIRKFADDYPFAALTGGLFVGIVLLITLVMKFTTTKKIQTKVKKAK